MTCAKNNSEKTAAIILAAGESKRFGLPKQTLRLAGQTLLERAVTTVLDSPVDKVIVVLGANAPDCRKILAPYRVQVVMNNNWRDGISASIRTGLTALDGPEDGNFDSALFLMCDQPRLSVQLITDLIVEFRSGEALIVASSYAKCLGTPALFSRRLFPEIIQLRGDSGAKSLILKYQEKNQSLVSSVEFQDGEIDIDIPSDIDSLLA